MIRNFVNWVRALERKKQAKERKPRARRARTRKAPAGAAYRILKRIRKEGR